MVASSILKQNNNGKKSSDTLKNMLFSVGSELRFPMQEKRLELSWYCYHTDLNRARLPIPPFLHASQRYLLYTIFSNMQDLFQIFFIFLLPFTADQYLIFKEVPLGLLFVGIVYDMWWLYL